MACGAVVRFASLHNNPLTDTDSMAHNEEFPAEEFAGVPDWNAAAWAHILVRDAKAQARSLRGAFLASRSLSELTAMQAVLMQEAVVADLQDEVAAEIALRGGND